MKNSVVTMAIAGFMAGRWRGCGVRNAGSLRLRSPLRSAYSRNALALCERSTHGAERRSGSLVSGRKPRLPFYTRSAARMNSDPGASRSLRCHPFVNPLAVRYSNRSVFLRGQR